MDPADQATDQATDDPSAAAEAKRSTAGVFGRAAATYDTVVPYFATFGRALVEAAGLRPGDRVLDVACGRGACLWPALDAVGSTGSVLGIDLAPEMVAALREAAAGAPNAEVRVDDAESPDVPDASFDAVTCGFGVFFLPHAEAALAAWRHALRPGGTVALSTFVGMGGWEWLPTVLKELLPEATRPPFAHPLVRSDALRAALARAGFADARTVDIGHRFVFPDLDAVVAWYGSHGGRAFMDRFDDDQAAAFREAARRHLDADHRAPEGGYELAQGAEATVATAP